MRILFLDDSVDRTAAFLSRAVNHAVFTETRPEDVIRTLEESAYNFDLVFLDHDLGDGLVGMTVIDHLVAIPFLDVLADPEAAAAGRMARRPVYVIHSINSPAALEMTLRLQRAAFNAVFKPFAWIAYPL